MGICRRRFSALVRRAGDATGDKRCIAPRQPAFGAVLGTSLQKGGETPSKKRSGFFTGHDPRAAGWAGRVTRPSTCSGLSRVEAGGAQNLTGRVGSGRARWFLNLTARVDPTRPVKKFASARNCGVVPTSALDTRKHLQQTKRVHEGIQQHDVTEPTAAITLQNCLKQQ